jgi:hypothetical protein
MSPVTPSQEVNDVIFGSDMLPTPTDDDSVTVKVSEDAHRRVEEAISHIAALAAMGPDWDTYGGRPLQSGAILHATRLLAAVLSTDAPAPVIVPTSEGGLQLEWHEGDADLEMEISPDRCVNVFLKLPNEQTWEGALYNSKRRLQAFLAYVSEHRPDQ